MSARDEILTAVRNAGAPKAPAAAVVPHPEPHDVDALRAQFLRVLAEVGGRGVVREPHQTVEGIVDSVLGAVSGTVIVRDGRFAVAENAAVYVDAADILERTDIVRGEHLVLVVPAAAVVPTMHEAVRRIPSDSACGWFLSGPSKTADIEQSLVYGAQGSRTHLVIFDS